MDETGLKSCGTPAQNAGERPFPFLIHILMGDKRQYRVPGSSRPRLFGEMAGTPRARTGLVSRFDSREALHDVQAFRWYSVDRIIRFRAAGR
ncbi:hypothetical protein [Chelativorans composti]|uniref:hypothetical protein n=1 Tax=Chelativorans composti TaxID=768533 RepID=UPI0031EB49CE